jgi:alanine dehydrogenase
MTMLYRDSDLEALLTPRLAVDALEEAFMLEADDRTIVPGRLNADAPGGWIRLMPAAIDATNGRSALGFKAMNLNQSTGVRYITVLYDADSGDLEAIMDAARLTRVRTAAVTAIACRNMRPQSLTELGLFGSGHEAQSHAEVFKALFPELERIVVYSPTRERRESFAAHWTERLGIDVVAAGHPKAAATAGVVVLATKAKEVVADAEWFAAGTLVLSIGSTRPELRELDEAIFRRARWCVGDAPGQLVEESGDVKAAIAAGSLAPERMVGLSDLVAGAARVEWPPDDLLIFKSVGTALQDLAVSRAVHGAGLEAGVGLDLGGFPVLH